MKVNISDIKFRIADNYGVYTEYGGLNRHLACGMQLPLFPRYIIRESLNYEKKIRIVYILR